MTNGWEARHVSLDGDPRVMAEVSTTQSWNGWAIVQMDAWSVVTVLDRLAEAYGSDFGDHGYTYDWREDGALLLTDLQAVAELRDNPETMAGIQTVEVLESNEDGLYGLGSYGWVWSVDPDEDDEGEDDDFPENDPGKVKEALDGYSYTDLNEMFERGVDDYTGGHIPDNWDHPQARKNPYLAGWLCASEMENEIEFFNGENTSIPREGMTL